MESKNKIKLKNRKRNPLVFPIIFAVLIIITGCMFLVKNLNIIDPETFHIIISWQMLLVVLGVVQFFRRHFIMSLLLICIGGFFLYPKIAGVAPDWIITWWPLLIILAGVLVLLRMLPYFGKKKYAAYTDSVYNSTDGYVVSENVFGVVRHIVLDPVFKGARIKNVFGGTMLDLRHTKLENEDTYIDVECTFGGVEIFIPADWVVVTDLQMSLAGCEDERYTETPDSNCKLVIRGKITFSGIEIKN
jgi:predicted membrane protein